MWQKYFHQFHSPVKDVHHLECISNTYQRMCTTTLYADIAKGVYTLLHIERAVDG